MEEINWTKLWIGLALIVGLTVVGVTAVVQIPAAMVASDAISKGYEQRVERAQSYNQGDHVIWVKGGGNDAGTVTRR